MTDAKAGQETKGLREELLRETAREILAVFRSQDDILKAYWVQEVPKALGMDKARLVLLPLIGNDEAEWTRLSNLKFAISIQMPTESVPEGVSSSPGQDPGTRQVGPFKL